MARLFSARIARVVLAVVAAAAAALSALGLVSPRDAASGATIHTLSVPVSFVNEDRPGWCVPATMSMDLQTYGLNVVQGLLAREMGSNQSGIGTSVQSLVSVLRSTVHRSVTVDSHPSVGRLRDELVRALRSGHGLILLVSGPSLPWPYHGAVPGHAILVSGVSGAAVTVQDPRAGTWGASFQAVAQATYASVVVG